MVFDATLIVVCFVAGLGLEWLMLLIARSPKFLAHPNARSSHRQPTPTMGGTIIAVVVVAYLASNLLMDQTLDDVQVPLLFACAALFGMAFVGLLDDLFSLKRRLRLTVQCLAGASAASD